MQDLEDYRKYRLSFKEEALLAAGAGGVLFLGAFVFYNSLLPAVLLIIPAVILLRKPVQNRLAMKRRMKLKKQFLSGVTLLGDYLKSGYSVENAIVKSVRELGELWGKDSDIVREWQKMAAELRISKTPEELFRDLGIRSRIPEIREFSELFAIVKRSGEQLSEIVKDTANLLTEQFAVEDQIRTVTAAKRFEQRIMDIMPLAILLYIRFSSPDLLSPLYTGAFGRILMSACILLYGAALYLSGRILKIQF